MRFRLIYGAHRANFCHTPYEDNERAEAKITKTESLLMRSCLFSFELVSATGHHFFWLSHDILVRSNDKSENNKLRWIKKWWHYLILLSLIIIELTLHHLFDNYIIRKGFIIIVLFRLLLLFVFRNSTNICFRAFCYSWCTRHFTRMLKHLFLPNFYCYGYVSFSLWNSKIYQLLFKLLFTVKHSSFYYLYFTSIFLSINSFLYQ